MDRLDLRGQSSPGGLAEGAEERALWAQFSEATTAEAFCRSWLTLQCRIIEGVTGALVLLGPADRGPFTPAAVWPNPRRSMKPLTPAAERALTERRGLLSRREAGGPDGDRYDVAYPIEVGGQLHGVVVLEVVPRPEGELQEVLRQLHWGAAWLEVLFRREQQAHDAAEKDRLRTVLDLAATAVGEQLRRTVKQSPLPLADLRGMHAKLGHQLARRALSPHRRQCNLRFHTGLDPSSFRSHTFLPSLDQSYHGYDLKSWSSFLGPL